MSRIHYAFIGVVFALILAVLLSPQAGEGDDGDIGPVLERQYGSATEAVVCCTWLEEGQEHSCAAASGQTCDICAAACA